MGKSKEEMQKLSRSTATEQDIITMIGTPDFWPKTFLPVINKNDGRVGVIFDQHIIEKKYVVKLHNMFMLPANLDDYNASPGVEYSSIKTLVWDGWEVD